jgi:hypothetical protein
MISMHLLEECEAIFKRDGKKAEKGRDGRKSGGKKDNQYVFISNMQG